MAITYPMDLLVDFPGWSTQFELFWRQEQSRTANGRTIVKDFGTPLWRATYQTRQLKPNALDYWKARLNALENGLQTFYARPTSRCYPIDDPRGEKLDSAFDGASLWLDFLDDVAFIPGRAAISSLSLNGKELALDGLPPDYKISAGDYLTIIDQVGPTLYQVVNGATAGPSGETTGIEVRPHLASGITVGSEVRFVKPYCIMTLVPGSISASSGTDARGVITFQAMEVR